MRIFDTTTWHKNAQKFVNAAFNITHIDQEYIIAAHAGDRCTNKYIMDCKCTTCLCGARSGLTQRYTEYEHNLCVTVSTANLNVHTMIIQNLMCPICMHGRRWGVVGGHL